MSWFLLYDFIDEISFLFVLLVLIKIHLLFIENDSFDSALCVGVVSEHFLKGVSLLFERKDKAENVVD